MSVSNPYRSRVAQLLRGAGEQAQASKRHTGWSTCHLLVASRDAHLGLQQLRPKFLTTCRQQQVASCSWLVSSYRSGVVQVVVSPTRKIASSLKKTTTGRCPIRKKKARECRVKLYCQFERLNKLFCCNVEVSCTKLKVYLGSEHLLCIAEGGFIISQTDHSPASKAGG